MDNNETRLCRIQAQLISQLWICNIGYVPQHSRCSKFVEHGTIYESIFDNLRLVNTYGAFWSVGRTRPELIIEGLDENGKFG